MVRFRSAVLVALLGGAPAAGSSPDPKDLAIPPHELTRARDLVRGLGSDVYREREDAEGELAKMGRLARPALSDAAAHDPDPEVRARAGRLLVRAAAADLRARIDTFLADADGQFDHDLPGWNPFRKAVGQDKPARELFTEMVKSPANVDLLAALDRPPAAAGQAIADRRVTLLGLLNRRLVPGGGAAATPVGLPDVAALLLADVVVPADKIPQAGPIRGVTTVAFFQQPVSLAALTNAGTPHAEPYKRLVAAWLETRVDPTDLSGLLGLTANHLKGFPQTPALLRRIAETKGVMGWARGQAIGQLVRENGKAEIPRLRQLLADGTELTTVWLGNGAVANGTPLLVRDVALAHLLTLSGQKLQDYGFTGQQGLPQGVTAAAFGSYGFTTPEARDAAFKKWAAWEKEQAEKGEKK